jgi:chemotaxis protein MotB
MWVVTYGDLMSLLMTFFVLLLSFSVMQEDEIFKEAMESFRGAVSVLPKELTVVQISKNTPTKKRQPKTTESVARRVRRRMQVIGQKNVQVSFEQGGDLKITFPNSVLFDSAQATLKATAGPVLDEMAQVLVELPQGAVFDLRGHTDDRPLGSSTRGFQDNFDLGFGRANAVTRYLSRSGRIPMVRFQAGSRGEGEPIATNETPEGRAENRRVDLYVRGLLTPEEVAEFQRETGSLTNTP